MAQTKLEDLEKTYQRLQSKMERIDQHAIRDKKGDFAITPQDELTRMLQSKINAKWKVQKLNTEIGYLRCNLFSEYNERIKLAKEKNELDKAVAFMKQYAEIAIPFVSTEKQPLIKRIGRWLLRKSPPKDTDRIRNWKDGYEAWIKNREANHPQMNNQEITEEYNKLKTAFFELYTYSFSRENFPPLRNRR